MNFDQSGAKAEYSVKLLGKINKPVQTGRKNCSTGQ